VRSNTCNTVSITALAEVENLRVTDADRTQYYTTTRIHYIPVTSL